MPIVTKNPATGETLAELKETEISQIPAMMDLARGAQREWARRTPDFRAKMLLSIRESLRLHLDETIELISKENGKPGFEALANELIPSLELNTFFAEVAPKVLSDHEIPMGLMKHRRSILNYWPVGTIAVISPWNYPWLLPWGEIMMSLVAGNAVLFKPSEITPLVGLQIQKICDYAGLPSGLLQTLIGDGKIGAALIDAKPNKVFFTGSVATGKKIMRACSENLIPISLELGGKDPMIVCEDANLDYATSAALWGSMSNSGQACASTERAIVHTSIAKEFTRLLAEKLTQLRQSNPQNPRLGAHDLGVTCFEKQKDTYQNHLDQARASGATVLAGGKFNSARTALEPTLVTGDDALIESTAIYCEETFGPTLAITPFKTDEEAIEKANNSSYGLLASVITGDLKRGEKIARQIEAGSVLVNEVLYTAGIPETPWGGVKHSGIGRKHSEHGLYEFVNVRHLHFPAARGLTFKSLWWFPYSSRQFALFRNFAELYRTGFAAKLAAMPRLLKSVFSFLLRDRRL